jgi:L-alanine-DL-glutamate epimerase-like enolase superfamily enzyme
VTSIHLNCCAGSSSSVVPPKPLEVRDGSIVVPKKPGLGIDVDEDVVRSYAV